MGGSPKGLERVGDRRMVDYVVAALAQVTDRTILVANDPAAATWLPKTEIVRDRHAGLGGLAGVEAALAAGATEERDAIAVAWDMPFVTAALLQSLLDAARAHDAEIVVPESDSPHGFEPFCAFYSARLRSRLSAFLGSGGGAAHEFIRKVARLHVLPAADIKRLGDPGKLLLSVNTPDDLTRARAMLAKKKSK